MFVEIGNFFYFLYIILGISLTLITLQFLKKKSEKFRYWFLFGILVFAFIVHFLKIFIYPYTGIYERDGIGVLRKISLENICAVSVVFFPFIYLSKSKILKDYLVMGGMVAGIVAVLFPVDAISPLVDGGLFEWRKPAYSLEMFRFYITHIIIFMVPFLTQYFKIHTISIKRAKYTPLVFLGVFVILFVNEVLLATFSLVPWDNLFRPDGRNPSLIFGIRPEFEDVAFILMIFVPRFLTVHPITGAAFYWPVVWMIIPVLIYSYLLVLFFCFICDNEKTVLYFKGLFGLKNIESET